MTAGGKDLDRKREEFNTSRYQWQSPVKQLAVVSAATLANGGDTQNSELLFQELCNWHYINTNRPAHTYTQPRDCGLPVIALYLLGPCADCSCSYLCLCGG